MSTPRGRSATPVGFNDALTVRIDTRQLEKLRSALIYAGASFDQSKVVLAQTMNRAGQRMRTDTLRHLRQWTGIRRRKEIAERVKPVRANRNYLQAGFRVYSPHLRLTKADFGATWSRSWPGGRHSAWNRRVTAKGTFMIPGQDYLVKRVGRARRPVEVVWGPNVAREIHRNHTTIRTIMSREIVWINGEILRRAHVGLVTAKSRFGL